MKILEIERKTMELTMAKLVRKAKTVARSKLGARKKQKNSKKKEEATRVTIRFDAGFSNNLYIRGNGAGLKWDQGVLLKNIGPDEWAWETNSHFDDCEFKVLINDQQYESGENHHIHYGELVQYTPTF